MHDIMPAQPPRHPYPWHTHPQARAQRQPRAVNACWRGFMTASGPAEAAIKSLQPASPSDLTHEARSSNWPHIAALPGRDRQSCQV